MKSLKYLLPFLLLQVNAAYGQTQDLHAGRALFQTNCVACHSIHREKTGPMLASITKKKDTVWLKSFIRNSQAVIANGDPYADALFNAYNHTVMPSFRQLTDEDISKILHYVEIESLHPTDVINSQLRVQQLGDSSVLRGELIFQRQCSSCHYIQHESSYAPALGSVTKRHSRQWLTSFIHNSQRVIGSGDQYAQQLYHRFDNHVMVSMEFLTKTEIDAVLDYIEYTSVSPSHVAGANGQRDNRNALAEVRQNIVNRPIQGRGFMLGLVIVVAVLTVGIFIYAVSKAYRYMNNA